LSSRRQNATEAVPAERPRREATDLSRELRGVLFGARESAAAERPKQPEIFVDLALDQVISAVTGGREEYDLAPFFWQPLRTAEAVRYRQAVVRDLADADVLRTFNQFATAMQAVRLDLARAGKHEHKYQKWRWRLDAENRYWAAVTKLDGDLRGSGLGSEALRSFRSHLAGHVAADRSQQRLAEGFSIASALGKIRYDLVIQGLRVEVRASAGEPDLGADIEAEFGAFSDGETADYQFEVQSSIYVNWVEGQILTLVGAVERETFGRLEAFAGHGDDFIDEEVQRFDREIQFYLGYLEVIRRLEKSGLAFCQAELAQSGVSIRDAFDLALALKLAGRGEPPVPNDSVLVWPERMIVVTGPNQGGKTTYARLIGQAHYLARLGLPLPARAASVTLTDHIFTHFERAERMSSLRGKLQDDLLRVHRILEGATPRSLIIINEIFTSTTLHDAVWLSEQVARRILSLGALCLWVTFVDEVASLGEGVVSMMSEVVDGDPSTRTFKIRRQPPSGLAFAVSIAERYRLTRDALLERLRA